MMLNGFKQEGLPDRKWETLDGGGKHDKPQQNIFKMILS